MVWKDHEWGGSGEQVMHIHLPSLSLALSQSSTSCRVSFALSIPHLSLALSQLEYPGVGRGLEGGGEAEGMGGRDGVLMALLSEVGLSDVLKRAGGDLDGRRKWEEEMSPGEQQRIGVARVLLRR